MIPIKITKKAASRIKEIINEKNIPNKYALRVGIKGGAGCGGFTHILGFDTKKTTDDEFKIEDINVIIDKKHMMYLIDLTLDFVQENKQSGFTFVSNSR